MVPSTRRPTRRSCAACAGCAPPGESKMLPGMPPPGRHAPTPRPGLAGPYKWPFTAGECGEHSFAGLRGCAAAGLGLGYTRVSFSRFQLFGIVAGAAAALCRWGWAGPGAGSAGSRAGGGFLAVAVTTRRGSGAGCKAGSGGGGGTCWLTTNPLRAERSRAWRPQRK